MRKKPALVLTIATLSFLISACETQSNLKSQQQKTATMSYSYHPGQGNTIVFQSGLGDGKSVWAKVISQLPQNRAYFSYDRYGYDASPSVATTRDACTIAHEQHDLLKQSGAKPPYLLVGHSIGGLYEYVYALLYPEEVAGVLLLDPTHPKHWETIQNEAPSAAAIIKTMRFTVFSPVMRKEFDAQTDCLNTLPTHYSTSFKTRILTSTLARAGEQGSYQDVLAKLRKDWIQLTGIAQTEPVDRATHYIQKDRPDSVVKAILEMNPL